MPFKHPSHSLEILLASAEAVAAGVKMIPRSSSDKEYFAQDWFAARLKNAGMEFEQQGRNSYPDFLITRPAPLEGYEVKSLRFHNGRPARRDIDFNSTIPSGRKNDSDVFLAFFLYTGSGAEHRTVHTLSLAHADLINADHLVADEHVNVAVNKFGSYGDGFIRNRKMYVFPHPVTIEPEGLGKLRLIVPAEWKLRDSRIRRVGVITREISKTGVEQYTIALYGRGQASVKRRPRGDAGKLLQFDVFETK